MLKLVDWIAPRTAAATLWRSSALAIAFGLLVITVVPPLTGYSKGFGGPIHDGYLELGGNLIRGHGFVFDEEGSSVVHRPPMYPALLSPLTLLPRPIQRPVLVLVQGLMFGAICAVVFAWARRFFGFVPAQIAVLVVWSDPWMLWVVKNPMSIVLQGLLSTTFLALVGFGVLPLLRERSRFRAGARPAPTWRWLVIGCLGAALALTHAAMLGVTVLVLAACALAAAARRHWRMAASISFSALTLVLLVSPWTYRNLVTFDRLIPVAGNAGFAYFAGNAHWGLGASGRGEQESLYAAAFRHAGIEVDDPELIRFFGLMDPDIDAEFSRRMIEHVRDEPALVVRKCLLNASEFYFPVVYEFIGPGGVWGRSPGASHRGERLVVDSALISAYHLVLWLVVFWAFARRRSLGDRRARQFVVLLGIGALVAPYLPFLALRQLAQYAFGTIPLIALLIGSAFVSDRGSPGY